MTRGGKYDSDLAPRKDAVSSADQWISFALGQIDRRLDGMDGRLAGIEKRLRWVERPLWMTFGAVMLAAAILKFFSVLILKS